MSNHIITSMEDWQKLAATLLKEAGETHLWTLQGNLGAGKTTLVKALCRALGVKTLVNSPSYSLIHEYPSHQGPIYHCDFHRISSPEELLQIGFESYLEKSYYTFVEWPKHAYHLLGNYFKLKVAYLSPTQRSVVAHHVFRQP